MQQDKDNLIAVISLSAAVWIICCCVLLIGFDGDLSIVALVLLGLFTYSSVMLWRTVFNARIAPMEFTFWLFNTNFLLLPALSQSVHRSFYWSSYEAYKQESLLFACFIIAISFFSFSIGQNIYHRKYRVIPSIPKIGKSSKRGLEETWGMYLFLLAGLAVVLLFIAKNGLSFYLASRSDARVESVMAVGVLMNVPRALAAGILLFSIFMAINQMHHGRRVTIPIMLSILSSLIVNSIVNNPLSTSRFWFFSLLISLIWIVIPLRSAMYRSVFVIGMTFLQFTVLPLLSQLARGKGQVSFNIKSFREYLQHGDFDGFQSIVNITMYIQDSGFMLGRNIISAILFFFPRSLWDSKAEPIGKASAGFMGYVFTNISGPIYGEFYADFGILSLLFFMGLLGYGMQYFDRYYSHLFLSKQPGVIVLYVAVISGFLIILMRGSLLSVISGIASLLGVLVILSWLSKRRVQSYPINDQHHQE